ncbi:MAG: PHP domain-containing protein [Clostridia bacterium]|nr:PHP domain-containing protein [Clostridia bacterium]
MKYRTELHCHTSEASGCADECAADTVEKYIALGYDTIVLTNHFSRYEFDEDDPDSYGAMVDKQMRALRLAKEAAGDRLNVLFGIELRLYENSNDYLVFGVTEEFLRGHPELLHMDVWGAHAFLNENGAMMIHAHPMRTGCTITDPWSVDGYEVYNGHNQQRSRNEMALAWASYGRSIRKRVIYTSGSDKHDRHHVPDGGIVTEEPITSMEQLLSVLESGNYKLMRGGRAKSEF